MKVFEEARKAWEALGDLRARRTRYKRFTYGRQWDDPIVDPQTGQVMTERALLSKDGRPPLTNNMIRQLVKTVIGRFRLNRQPSSEQSFEASSRQGFRLSRELEGLYELNQLDELDSRLLEEFLISSIAVQRVTKEQWDDGLFAPRVMNVSPNNFFVNLPKDPRGNDIEIIGMLHDLKPEEIVMRWGGSKRMVAQRLYSLVKHQMLTNGAETAGWGELTEFTRANRDAVRVVEVWKLEPFEQLRVHDPEQGKFMIKPFEEETNLLSENKQRRRECRPQLIMKWEMTRRWVGRWFLGDGTLLHSVYAPVGKSHPFIVKMYPLIDGEIHSLVEDVIDQQKYINRLVNLLDRMMATAAKGALLFPVDALPEGCDFEDITSQWSATDGVVLYKSTIGDEPPKQITTTVGDIGARDLLKTEMQLFKDISGVSDTLSGKNISAKIGADRYNMEIESAATSIRDLIDTFGSFIETRDRRLLALC